MYCTIIPIPGGKFQFFETIILHSSSTVGTGSLQCPSPNLQEWCNMHAANQMMVLLSCRNIVTTKVYCKWGEQVRDKQQRFESEYWYITMLIRINFRKKN